MKKLSKSFILFLIYCVVILSSCKKEESDKIDTNTENQDENPEQEDTSPEENTEQEDNSADENNDEEDNSAEENNDEGDESDFVNENRITIEGETFTPCNYCVATSQGINDFDVNISKSNSSPEYINLKMPINFTKETHNVSNSTDYYARYYDGSTAYTTKNDGSGTITILKATYDEEQFIDTLYLDFSFIAKDATGASINASGELRLY